MIDLPNGWEVAYFLQVTPTSYRMTIKKNMETKHLIGISFEEAKDKALFFSSFTGHKPSSYEPIINSIKSGEPYYTEKWSQANYIKKVSIRYGERFQTKTIVKNGVKQFKITALTDK